MSQGDEIPPPRSGHVAVMLNHRKMVGTSTSFAHACMLDSVCFVCLAYVYMCVRIRVLCERACVRAFFTLNMGGVCVCLCECVSVVLCVCVCVCVCV